MQKGWISLHRELIEHEIYADPYLVKLWVHCLLKASHTEREQMVGRQLIKLEPGQFITGRDALSREFNQGASKKNIVASITLWRWLLLFENLGMLNIKKTTKYSVVTVVNWSKYQHTEQQMNNKRTANEQEMNTNNNVNNVNKKDKVPQQADERFDLWWNLYAKKQGRAQCEKKFRQLLKKYDYTIIEAGTQKYLQYLQQNNVDKKFQKNPLTFLNGEHFNDEYEVAQIPQAGFTAYSNSLPDYT